MNQFQHLLEPLQNIIKTLTTPNGGKVQIINQVAHKQYTLLSLIDLNNPYIPKFNPIPVDFYLEHVLLAKAGEDLNNKQKEDEFFEKCFTNFKSKIIDKIDNVKNILAKLSNELNKKKFSSFINDFSNGILTNSNEFIESLQGVISGFSGNNEAKSSQLQRIKELFDNFNLSFEDLEEELMWEINLIALSGYPIPNVIRQVDQITINQGKWIPSSNGIDIHPTKNIYIAMGCNDGDLVIRNQNTNQEIKRIKLNNNSGGATQNCLWSPSGKKIMVSTRVNHSIYIYDENGEKLLKSIEKTCSTNAWGAIWLSEKDIAVGYDDNIVKFFDLDEEIEIGKIKLNGCYAWGMDCLDESHLLVGDNSGTISNIDWKNNVIVWKKKGWHANNNCIRCLKLNSTKNLLLSGSSDKYVKLMKIKDQSKLWEFKLNGSVYGIAWVPGELYVLALSYSNQLIAINSKTGTKLLEFTELTEGLCSLRINPRMTEMLIGDDKGTVRRLRIF